MVHGCDSEMESLVDLIADTAFRLWSFGATSGKTTLFTTAPNSLSANLHKTRTFSAQTLAWKA